MTRHEGRRARTVRERLRAVGAEDGDRGAGTVEYLGAILVVGAVIAALLMTATPIGGTVAAKLCAAVGASCGDDSAIDVTEAKPAPERACTVQTDATHLEAGVTVAFISLGEKGDMTVTRLSDGTYQVVVSGELGATAALSAGEAYGTIEIGEYGVSAGAEAEVNAGVFAGAGVEYSFPDKASADKFTEWVGREVARAGATSVASGLVPGSAPVVGIGSTVGGWLWDKITGYDYQPPAPTAEYFEGGISAGGSASAGGLTAGGNASLDYQNALGFRYDNETGDRTIYTRVSIDGEAAVQLGFSASNADWGTGAAGSGSVEMVVATTVDANLDVTSVELNAAATADGSYALTSLASVPLQGSGGRGVQLSAQFDVTDANRSRVLATLASLGAVSASTGSTATGTAAAIPLILQEARTNGDITAQFVDAGSSNLVNVALGAEVPVVGGLGGKFGASTSSSTSTDAYYLGDHGWMEWTACA